MNTKTKEQFVQLTVGGGLTSYVAELATQMGVEFDDPRLLEGVWLAMQMIGGPRRAIAMIDECMHRPIDECSHSPIDEATAKRIRESILHGATPAEEHF